MESEPLTGTAWARPTTGFHGLRRGCSTFVFWHIASTGGRSINNLLRRYTACHQLIMWPDQGQVRQERLCTGDGCVPPTASLLANATFVYNNPHLFTECHCTGFGGDVYHPARLPAWESVRPAYAALGCRLIVGTILRHPTALWLSWYRHFGGRMPVDRAIGDQRELVLQWWGVHKRRAPDGSWQLNYSSTFTAAVIGLTRFDWLGLTERFDESSWMLLRMLGLGGSEASGAAVRGWNVSAPHVTQLSADPQAFLQLAANQSVLEAVEAANSWSLRLYSRARREFGLRLAKAKQEAAGEVTKRAARA